ncbi:putative aquaporin [Aspergillus ellipticus CBS 707.79]|uniref:Putative aquaporin n=1 Tax=Aspergillus ellipticus CBS 707.79 TaxID=1448320 RepID=A0A319DM49_9EURO|nr:putative aquaporin [Aspergillus ellipticus CBS 707.79]
MRGTSKCYEYNEPWNRRSTASLAVPPLDPGGSTKYYEGNNPRDSKIDLKAPAATANVLLFEVLDFRGFLNLDLWKFAVLECVASMMNTFLTSWVALHPPSALASPQTELGIYHTSTFFSPLFTGLTMTFLVPLLIYTLAPSSGGHINPTLTMATFFARMITFPQMVLYIVGQTFGGALGGFAINTAYGSRDFTVGGCSVNTSVVSVKDALAIEFMGCLILIYVAFGVALDPRQGRLFSHAASPWFIGIILGLVTWASAFTREGYSGASLNPARCFGSYVASTFPSYHWIHWFGPFAAALVHAVIYYLSPAWVDPRTQSS